MSRIDRVLEAARRRYRRLAADQVPEAARRGAVLVDIRPQAQRAREGEVPGALVIERNVLEWRCDPTSDARLPQAVDDDVEWVDPVLGGLHLEPGGSVAAGLGVAPGHRCRRWLSCAGGRRRAGRAWWCRGRVVWLAAAGWVVTAPACRRCRR